MNKKNGTIEVRLPYPFKVGFITIFVKRKIGFSFDQRSIFNLLQNCNIDLPKHGAWLKSTPKGVIVSETIYAAAQSYCIERQMKYNFTKEKLAKSLSEADRAILDSIIKTWKESELFGKREVPTIKKKVKASN